MSSTGKRVAELLALGRSIASIAEELGIARNTASYHAERLRLGAAHPPAPVRIPDGRHHASKVATRTRVAALLDEGLSKAEISRRLGVSRSTVTYHAGRLHRPIDQRCARRYDWSAIQRFYDAGHSISECQAAFGFSRETWNAARRRGAVAARPQAMPLEQLLSRPRNRSHLKRRLIKLGLKEDRCEQCGTHDWRGRPLSMALHHVNGDGSDNRLANLQLLCPNCHSQTENYSGRNGHRRVSSAGAPSVPQGQEPVAPVEAELPLPRSQI